MFKWNIMKMILNLKINFSFFLKIFKKKKLENYEIIYRGKSENF
jgi:hypothetical protein